MDGSLPERFDELPLDERLLRGIADMGFERMTEVQRRTIPVGLRGGDLAGMAQTGTGKTAAFLVPIIERLLGRERGKTRALVLTPTRELAVQIDEQMTALAYHTGLTSAFIVGGLPMGSQERAIKAGSDVLIATPGRILDHTRYGYVDFDAIEVCVLDEADRMLDMGFFPDVERILRRLPLRRQTMLFSATMPPEIRKLARAFLRGPVEIRVGLQRPVATVRQRIYEVAPERRERLLLRLLGEEGLDSALIFCRTKIGVRKLASRLRRSGIRCDCLHGDRPQSERNEVLESFRRREIRALVATDVASRGLDISGVSHVINFDVPRSPDDYLHRVGRTARAEASGDAVTFAGPRDAEDLVAIERAIGHRIERADPGWLPGGRRRGRRRRRR